MRGVILAAALAAAGAARGQVVSEGPDRAAVVIYRDRDANHSLPAYQLRLDPYSGLAMISEVRTVDLPAGRSRVAFRGVAETMVAQTAAVEGLPGAVIERNQDYDLMSPGALMEAAVGETVTLVRTNPGTGQATSRRAVLRAGAAGAVFETDAGVEALHCSGLPERIVFDRLPEGLTDRPTFSVLADAPSAGRYKVRLTYLATGFDWSADYVATLRPDGRSVDLIGWLTLGNHTATSFALAPTEVVAGELARDGDTAPQRAEASTVGRTCWPRALAPPPPPPPPPSIPPLPVPPVQQRIEELVVTGSRVAVQSDLGDYKLYTLPEPTTVAARQTKQVLFLDQKAVPVEKVHAFTVGGEDYAADGEPSPARMILRLRNEARRGLGKALPSGVVAVMEPSARGLVLAGEDEVKDTPVGLTLDLEVGRSPDIQVAALVRREWEQGDVSHAALELRVTNAAAQPALVEIRQPPTGSDFKVGRASQRPGTKNGDAFWVLRVPANGGATLRYEVSSR